MINQQFLMAWMVCYFVLDINLSIYFSLISVLGVIPPQFIITWKEKNTMQSLQSFIELYLGKSIMGAKINFNIKSMCWVLVHVLVYVNELYTCKWQWPQWFCGRWSWNQRIYFEKKKKTFVGLLTGRLWIQTQMLPALTVDSVSLWEM